MDKRGGDGKVTPVLALHLQHRPKNTSQERFSAGKLFVSAL